MAYNKFQEKAWEHLTHLEKSALSLVVVHERTRQEASIILNISPYKFLELYSRARRLFILFTEYYEKHNFIIPYHDKLESHELSFLDSLLRKRLRVSRAIAQYPDTDLFSVYKREALWELFLRDVPENNQHAQDFKYLLIEYDKWNSFRILPKQYRSVSPYSRKRIREFKKVYETIENFTDVSWAILETYAGTKDPPLIYAPCLELGTFTCKPLKLSDRMIKYYTENKIPVFLKEEDAIRIAELVFDYNNLKKKSSHSSQKFWASFRDSFKKAKNYNELLGISEGELYELQARDKAFIQKAMDKTTPRRARVRMSKDGNFWT